MYHSNLAPSEEALGARVLVVDDSRETLDVLTKILSKKGYRVESRRDGESCWERLIAGVTGKAPLPDLLLLDLMLPGLSGMALLRRIRNDERFARLPVVILTVQDAPSTRLKALKAGANDYIAKPFETVELLARVRTLLGWKIAERFQERKMEYLVEAGRILLSTLDLDRVLKRVLEIAMAGLNAEGISIWLKTEDDGLVCQSVSGEASDRLLGMRMNPGQGIVGWVLQHRQSARVLDVQADPRFFPGVSERIEFETRDLVAVPLLMRGRSIGVLEAVNKREGQFSPADVAWMEVLAPLAAASIANARLFNTLRRRTSELQKRNKELDAFAHTVAHDLQNPLTLIIGFTETLQRDFDTLPTEETQEHLQTIARISRKMNNIIDELMLLSQVRKMKVQMQPLHMTEILDDALEQLAYAIEKTDAEIVQLETWPEALGHAPWVEEVWVNYIHNAIKYGGQPPRVELGARTQPNGTVRFWVRDNGQGLTQEEQDQLFTPFIQLERIRIQGHGLGLSIVQRIVEKLGGQVGVTSQVGEGSTFWFTLSSKGS